MVHTDLVKSILDKANCIMTEFSGEYLCASHVAAAFADFCKERYTGFAFSSYSYPRFEDERVRYLFSKEVKLSSFFKMRLARNRRDCIVEEPFDTEECEHIASLREANMLSADVVLLCALRDLHDSYRSVVRSVCTENSVLALLQDADVNVYDYVIQNIESICADLRKKAEEAAAIRDWKPASKFAEPEEVIQMVFDGIDIAHTGNITTVKIPKFFGNNSLSLSFHMADEIFYVHDNGCTLRYMKKAIRDDVRYERALKRVCHSGRIDRGRITGSFTNATGFMYYLKDLIFVAQADLYYPKAKRHLCIKDKGYVYIPDSKAEPFDDTYLINMLKESVSAYYDENDGLCCLLKAGNSPFQTRYAFLVETLEDGDIRLSDKLKGKYEGELLESCYWYHDDQDISVYRGFFTKMAERFGAEFDGKNVYLTANPKDFRLALYRFFQFAVLISRFGHDIKLPKVR